MKTLLPSSPTMHCLVTEGRLNSSRLSSSTISPRQRSAMPLTLSMNSNLKLQSIERRQKTHFSTSGTSTACRVSAPFKGLRASKAWRLFRLVSAFGLSHPSLAESQNVLPFMLRMMEGLWTIQMIQFSGCGNRLYGLTFILRRSVLTSSQTMRTKMPLLRMIRVCVLGSVSIRF